MCSALVCRPPRGRPGFVILRGPPPPAAPSALSAWQTRWPRRSACAPSAPTPITAPLSVRSTHWRQNEPASSADWSAGRIPALARLPHAAVDSLHQKVRLTFHFFYSFCLFGSVIRSHEAVTVRSNDPTECLAWYYVQKSLL
jgi:hypothetical protein